MRSPRPGPAKTTLAGRDFDSTAGRAAIRGVVADLEALVAGHARRQVTAGMRGTTCCGDAALIQCRDARALEALRVSWEHNEIKTIEIEERIDLSFFREMPEVAPIEVVDAVLPMLWKHIRGGRSLPDGIDRFTGFLSVR